MRSYMRIVLSFVICYGAALFASYFIDANVGSWYASLSKPFFVPPNYIFPIVWTVLYGVMAASLAIVWINDPSADEMTGWVPMFLVHLVPNIAWIIFFFGLHAVFIAFIDIVILFFAALILFFGAFEIDRRAAWLLLPYLLWLFFAAMLNLSIWLMN